MNRLIRNRMDEDWDERRDGGCDVPEMELSEFEKRLNKKRRPY